VSDTPRCDAVWDALQASLSGVRQDADSILAFMNGVNAYSKLARELERELAEAYERAAKVLDEMIGPDCPSEDAAVMATDCAAAIRALAPGQRTPPENAQAK
jgi:hypothetical protein